MDRMAKRTPTPDFDLMAKDDWKEKTTLADLSPSQWIEVTKPSGATVYATVAQLIRSSKMPEWMTLEQVESAFSMATEANNENGSVVPMWRLPDK